MSNGQTFTPLDDGVGADIAAGDGIYTATFTPAQAFASINFTSPDGSEQVTMADLQAALVSGPTSEDLCRLTLQRGRRAAADRRTGARRVGT